VAATHAEPSIIESYGSPYAEKEKKRKKNTKKVKTFSTALFGPREVK